MLIDQSLEQQTIIRIKILRPFSHKKVPGEKAYKNIYDLHNLAPSPSKALYIQLGMENFVAVCTFLIMLI